MCERYNEPWFIKCFQRYIKFWKLFNIETLRPSCADFLLNILFLFMCVVLVLNFAFTWLDLFMTCFQ